MIQPIMLRFNIMRYYNIIGRNRAGLSSLWVQRLTDLTNLYSEGSGYGQRIVAATVEKQRLPNSSQ